MVIVVAQDFTKRLVLGMMNCFDDVLEIAGVVEEAARFARRAEFGKNVSAGEGYEVVCRVEVEYRS